MGVKVFDFYVSGKLSANRIGKFLMRDSLFCIIVELNGVVKELATTITKKYHYKEFGKTYDFDTTKALEYYVLVDFLINAKDRVMEKWNMTETDYQELKDELALCLIKRYSKCNILKKGLLLGQAIARKLIHKWK